VSEPGLDRLIHAGYRLLGLQTFFTVGETKCAALDHAPRRHRVRRRGRDPLDFQRGFIRAETSRHRPSRGVGSYKAGAGSRGWYEARAGLRRAGWDILLFRFNV